jgi:DNA repair protein RecN (Recombination protein N)
LDELSEAGFREQELEELDQELKLLNIQRGSKTMLSKVYYDLKEGEQPLVQQLRSLQHSLGSYSAYHPGLSAFGGPDVLAQIELQDIAGEVDQHQ